MIWNDKNSEDKQQLTTNGLKGSVQPVQEQDSADLIREQSYSLNRSSISEDSYESFVEQLQIATLYTFDIGRSIENVSLNMVLHFY